MPFTDDSNDLDYVYDDRWDDEEELQDLVDDTEEEEEEYEEEERDRDLDDYERWPDESDPLDNLDVQGEP
jgi:hypothetical protein